MRINRIAESLLYIVIGVCILSGGKEIYRRVTAVREYDRLDSMMESGTEEETVFTDEGSASDDVFTSFSRINPDFIGILYIPELDIRYPIVQGKDNEKYLGVTFEGKENPAGCIFIDYENSRDLSDNITYIYGHNMKDGSMFGSLKKLLNADIEKASVKAYISTKDRHLKYELVDVKVTDVNKIKDLKSESREIILYTCWSNQHDKRLLTTFRSC